MLKVYRFTRTTPAWSLSTRSAGQSPPRRRQGADHELLSDRAGKMRSVSPISWMSSWPADLPVAALPARGSSASLGLKMARPI
jgi:hypothetical protein